MKKFWLLPVLTLFFGLSTAAWRQVQAQDALPAPLPGPMELPPEAMAAAASPSSGSSSAEQQLLQEIITLRLEIDKQRREIQALREEVAQVHALVEGKPYRKPSPAPAAKPQTTTYEEAGGKPNSGQVAEAKPKPKEDKPGAGKPYKVQQGDTLSAIARKNDISLSALQKANPGVDPKSLKPGMELKIP